MTILVPDPVAQTVASLIADPEGVSLIQPDPKLL